MATWNCYVDVPQTLAVGQLSDLAPEKRTAYPAGDPANYVFATADIQEWSNMDELKKVVAQANEKVPSLKFQAIETYPLPQFRTQYLVPYQNGVPTRLFLRAARQFATFFDMGMGVDKKNEVLRSALT